MVLTATGRGEHEAGAEAGAGLVITGHGERDVRGHRGLLERLLVEGSVGRNLGDDAVLLAAVRGRPPLHYCTAHYDTLSKHEMIT